MWKKGEGGIFHRLLNLIGQRSLHRLLASSQFHHSCIRIVEHVLKNIPCMEAQSPGMRERNLCCHWCEVTWGYPSGSHCCTNALSKRLGWDGSLGITAISLRVHIGNKKHKMEQTMLNNWLYQLTKTIIGDDLKGQQHNSGISTVGRVVVYVCMSTHEGVCVSVIKRVLCWHKLKFQNSIKHNHF